MKKTYLLITAIFFAWWSSILSSCNFSTAQETITFILPQWPPEISSSANKSKYPELEKWFIEIEGSDISQNFFTQEKSIQISLAKNIPCAITATPITKIQWSSAEQVTTTSNTSFFYPAGAIYPYYTEECLKQNFTWEEGYTATLMQSIYRSNLETGITPEHLQNFQKDFNWKKCQDLINQKTKDSSKAFYNPWQNDTKSLLDNLCYAYFSAGFLTPKNIYSVELENVGLAQFDSLLSRYIPENQNIEITKTISLQKDKTEFFMCDNFFNAQIILSSPKKVSVAYTYLPILY